MRHFQLSFFSLCPNDFAKVDMIDHASRINSLESQISKLENQLQALRNDLTAARRDAATPQSYASPEPHQFFASATDRTADYPMGTSHFDDMYGNEILSALAASEAHSMSPETIAEQYPLELEEYKRYGRQLIMPEVGLAGQLRLKKARVLIIGVGGLGCPAAMYLAGAGVGTLGLVDGDAVESSNLHRQVLHNSSTVGRSKVDSAVEGLRRCVMCFNHVFVERNEADAYQTQSACGVQTIHDASRPG